MGKINWARVLLGGLLAGTIINVFEFVTNGVFLAPEWKAMMEALGRTTPPSAGGAVIFLIWGLSLRNRRNLAVRGSSSALRRGDENRGLDRLRLLGLDHGAEHCRRGRRRPLSAAPSLHSCNCLLGAVCCGIGGRSLAIQRVAANSHRYSLTLVGPVTLYGSNIRRQRPDGFRPVIAPKLRQLRDGRQSRTYGQGPGKRANRTSSADLAGGGWTEPSASDAPPCFLCVLFGRLQLRRSRGRRGAIGAPDHRTISGTAIRCAESFPFSGLGPVRLPACPDT